MNVTLMTQQTDPQPIFHRGCVIERVFHSGMYVTRHDYEGRLMADTLRGLKAMIRAADQKAIQYSNMTAAT